MYDLNHLARHLQSASLKKIDATFIHLHENDQLISFEDFFQNAEKIASALISAGIRPGDRVAMQVEKSSSALELYFGTILAGAGLLPLNTAYVTEEIDFFLRDARPSIFVCDPSKLDNLTKIAKSNKVCHIWTLSAEGTGSLIDAKNSESPGFTESGLPVGLQLIGPPRGEAKVLAVARVIELAIGVIQTPIDPIITH